jgi:hypothetical protein
MRIYIAASYTAKLRLRPIRDALFALGHDVLTTWLDEQPKQPDMTQDAFERKLAIKDLVEAGGADLLILDTLEPSTTGGRHTEWGIGLGRFQRQLLYIVGPRENVFHRLADRQFDTWTACLEALAAGAPPLVHWIEPDFEKVFLTEQAWLEREGPND